MPLDVHEAILDMLSDRDKSTLKAVCKKFRNIIHYFTFELKIYVHRNILCEHSCLYMVPNVKILHFVNVPESSYSCIDSITTVLSCVTLSKLQAVILEGLTLENKVVPFLQALSRCQNIEMLDFRHCSRVSVDNIKISLALFPKLTFCSLEVIFQTTQCEKEFAALANKLQGKVNFHINNMERIPSGLLQFDRESYRQCYPRGSDNKLNN